MSRQTDQPENPNSVPPAELNPLLNPLLAKHMGRWAETYFTSPPEKREEAVQELLRQLREESSTRPAEEPIPVDQPIHEPLQPVHTRVVSALPMVLCQGCGHENAVDQKFCGMCGATIQKEPSHAESAPSCESSASVVPETGSGFHHFHQIDSPRSDEDQEGQNPRRDLASIEEVREIYTRNTQAGDFPLFEPMEPSFAYRHRVFIGLVLAAIIGGLLFMSWRSGQTVSGLSQQAPQNSATTEPAAQPPADGGAAEKSATAQPTPPKERASSSPTAAEQKGPSKPETKSTKPENGSPTPQTHPAKFAPRETSAPPTTTQPATGATGGGEELAMAKRYLSGSGASRNPAEAADWLWKSVAKQNTEATVMLADLYLKGDGISKNCDQARVLLDAAARKGRTDASERLRHLQAFGCR